MDVRTKIITKEVQEWADAFMDMRLDYWKSTASVEPQTEEKEGMWTPENSIKSDLRVLLDNVKSSPSLQEHSAKPDSIKGLGNLFAFLHILTRLKSTRRTGWVDFGIHEPESIADHMYRMGMICMLTNNHDTLNYSRCVSIAVVHDMAEALVGDILLMIPFLRKKNTVGNWLLWNILPRQSSSRSMLAQQITSWSFGMNTRMSPALRLGLLRILINLNFLFKWLNLNSSMVETKT